MGLGAISLIALFAVLVWVSLLRQQAFAQWMAGLGLFLLAYFGLSVALGESLPVLALPYRVINIYLFLLLALVFTFASAIGLLVRVVRRFRYA